MCTLAESIPVVAAALGSAISLVDKLYDQVKSFIANRKETKLSEEHSLRIESTGSEILQIINGRVVKTIAAADFAKLPESTHRHIMVLEKSMQNSYDLWAQVYPQRNSSADPMVNAKVNQQLKQIIIGMKEDLDGILGYLDSLGFYLDDHYMEFRYLVSKV
mgnify:CR=1 FL=1